jgi:N-formylglutamate deformylase
MTRDMPSDASPWTPDWLVVRRGSAPLIVSLPHTGTTIPADIAETLISPWLARKDTDWWIEKLYAFAAELDATLIRTTLSRTVIDVNRDPSGVSLYPGQATTELCPTTTFDGEALYRAGQAPDATAIAARRTAYFDPYHAALRQEIDRLSSNNLTVVLYDCHSIRSVIPRLFDDELPNFNLGTDSGSACAPHLTAAIEAITDATAFSRITNGRFKGGFITRHYGAPERGIHAVQMELACRGYMPETPGPVEEPDWPTPYDPVYAEPMRRALHAILTACLDFTKTPEETP